VELLDIHLRLGALPTGKHVAGPLQQLALPLRDLVRVNVKSLCPLRQRLTVFQCG